MYCSPVQSDEGVMGVDGRQVQPVLRVVRGSLRSPSRPVAAATIVSPEMNSGIIPYALPRCFDLVNQSL